MILICFSGVLNMLKTMALKFFENSEKKFDGRHAIWKLLITFEVINLINKISDQKSDLILRM